MSIHFPRPCRRSPGRSGYRNYLLAGVDGGQADHVTKANLPWRIGQQNDLAVCQRQDLGQADRLARGSEDGAACARLDGRIGRKFAGHLRPLFGMAQLVNLTATMSGQASRPEMAEEKIRPSRGQSHGGKQGGKGEGVVTGRPGQERG